MSNPTDHSRRDHPEPTRSARGARGHAAAVGAEAGPPRFPGPSVGARVRQLTDWARLETAPLTGAFWLAVAGFVAAYWVTPLPPCIDYPQHLALGAIIRRLIDPSSPERQLYEFTPLTYNGLFHVAVAGLSLLASPETAGKLLLSSVPVLTGAAMWLISTMWKVLG